MTTAAPNGRQTSFRRFRSASGPQADPTLTVVYGLSGNDKSPLDLYQYAGAGDDHVSMRGAAVEGTRTGRMLPRADHIVFWIGDGTATVTPEGGQPLSPSPGVPMFLSAGVAYDFTADTRKVSMLHLSDVLLRSVLLDRVVPAPRPLTFDEEPIGDESVRVLQQELRRSAPVLADTATSAALRETVNRRIAEAVLETFTLHEPPRELTTAVERAVSHVHEHAQSPLVLQDLADAAQMSVRGLQSAFARDVGTSPMAYVREVRMEGAHRDLTDGAVDTVAAVVESWQLGHLGRFANAYAQRYGERPSETLKRGRAAR